MYQQSWKLLKSKPVFKKEDKLLKKKKNYWPISVLSSVSKLLDKLKYNDINAYLEEINFFSEIQHGFLKGRNRTTAVTQLV